MFELAALLRCRTHARAGAAQLVSEFVATFGLLAGRSRGCARARAATLPFAVGAYITAAYWFTASTSFANPAVTLARARRDTFAGIRPADVPGFVAAQLAGRRRGARALAGCARAGAEARMKTRRLRLRAQRRPLADGGGVLQRAAPTRRARARVSAGTEPGDARASRGRRRRCARSASTSRDARPQRLTDELAARRELLVTMGCGEACPLVPGLRRDDWPLEIRRASRSTRVRAIRDEIRAARRRARARGRLVERTGGPSERGLGSGCTAPVNVFRRMGEDCEPERLLVERAERPGIAPKRALDGRRRSLAHDPVGRSSILLPRAAG